MNIYPWIGLAVAVLTLWKCQVFTKVILPAAVGLVVICLWQLACDHFLSDTNPTPGQTLAAIFEIVATHTVTNMLSNCSTSRRKIDLPSAQQGDTRRGGALREQIKATTW